MEGRRGRQGFPLSPKGVGLRRRVVDALVRRLRPQWIRTGLLPLDYERFAPAERMEHLPAGAVLSVVAPHPDDESIGPGGLVALWTGAGRVAEVVFLTDGAAGNPALRAPGLAAAERDRIAAATAATRRTEAESALAILGARGRWMGGTDGALWRDEAALAERLAEAWRAAPPDVIAMPYPADRHPDHAVAARIVAAAAGQAALPAGTSVLCYEVWSPCPANAVLDISTVAATKAAAIATHASQTATTDYVAASRGLNSYRAITAGLPPDRLAEAFHRLTPGALADLCARLKV